MKRRAASGVVSPGNEAGTHRYRKTTTNWLSGGGRTAAAFALVGLLTSCANAQQTNVVAHEWGTFTSIAGNEGKAVQWYPWAVPSDLPGFVEHFRSGNFKPNLSGTIRMETPVLYFYAAEETTLSVRVSFSKGLITEWYPHATSSAPSERNLRNAAISGTGNDGGVTWTGIMLRPASDALPPHEQTASRYYAARLTNSTALSVRAAREIQTEKFLFYRGVSSAESPLDAKVLADGNVEVASLAQEPVAKILCIERRGGATGMQITTSLEGRALMHAPALSGSVEAAEAEMLSALMDQGLYPDEAHAMLETWKDSWFEEGSRLLYIVPKSFVDRVLPLSISPMPAETTRVFVGRLELVTPKTQSAIETALAAHDERALARYSRFLQPMLEILLQREANPLQAQMIRQRLEQPYAPLPSHEAAAIAARN